MMMEGIPLDCGTTDKIVFNYFPKETNIPIFMALDSGQHVKFNNEEFVKKYWKGYFAWVQLQNQPKKEDICDDDEED